MRHRSIKSRAGKVMLGAVLAGALSGAGASIARATLTLDLEPLVGTTQYTPNNPDTAVTVASGTTSLSVEVYGVVIGGAGTALNDGLGGAFASFDATGTAGTGLSLALTHPTFDYDLGSAASDGSSYSYVDSAGATHHGIGNYNGPSTAGPTTPTYDSTTPNNWAFAAYLNNNGTTVASILTPGTALTSGYGNGSEAGAGAYFDLGTLTLSLNGSAANGSTSTVNAYGRTQQSGSTMVAALWTENGVVTTPAAGTAIAADDSLMVTIGSIVVSHLPGDTNGDGKVDINDYNNVINNFGDTETPYMNGDATGDGKVDINDYNAVINNFGNSSSAIIAAPEPASIGLLALGGLGILRRRRR